MTIDVNVMEEIDDMQASVEPTRESITGWYDWLSVIRDELAFEAARCTYGLDSQLASWS